MTNKETINRNIGLAFDLLHKINNNPELLDKIPNGTTIEFLEKDFIKKEKADAICVYEIDQNRSFQAFNCAHFFTFENNYQKNMSNLYN